MLSIILLYGFVNHDGVVQSSTTSIVIGVDCGGPRTRLEKGIAVGVATCSANEPELSTSFPKNEI